LYLRIGKKQNVPLLLCHRELKNNFSHRGHTPAYDLLGQRGHRDIATTDLHGFSRIWTQPPTTTFEGRKGTKVLTLITQITLIFTAEKRTKLPYGIKVFYPAGWRFESP
jgi:hypothetical protein